MSGFVPKERLAAYQNLQMTDFDDEEELDIQGVPVAKTVPKTAKIMSEEKAKTAEAVVPEDFGNLPYHERIKSSLRQGELLPKEQMSAYERYEMADFRAPPPPPNPEAAYEVPLDHESDFVISEEPVVEELPEAPPEPEPEPIAEEVLVIETPTEPALVLPTAEEIEKIYEEARTQGFAAGHEEALLSLTNEMTPAIESIKGLAETLKTAVTTVDQTLCDNLLALAITLAEQVLKQSLKLHPELVLPIVQEAVAALNAKTGTPLLFLHPDDVSIVRTHLGETLQSTGWKIIEDPKLTIGGCRVELGSGEVDARLETRWHRVIAALGVNEEWLKVKTEET